MLAASSVLWRGNGWFGVKFLELYTESVFFGWYRSVFLGNYHTDTEGKLGRYFQYRRYKKVSIYSK